MADNVTFQSSAAATPPANTVVATDDVSSVHYQVIKIGLGADGALDNLLDAGQQLSAASLPVVLSSDHSDIKVTLDSESVTISGTVQVQSNSANLATETTLSAIQTAVELIDNVVSGSEAQVDLVDGGPIGATTDVEASGDGSVIAILKRLRTLLGGTLTVDATGQGDIPITLDGESVSISGTVTVDSELTTADLDTGVGTDTRAVVGLVSAESGGGTLVGSANPLPVDGSGVTQPISGTVTANLSATDNAVLDSIQAATEATQTAVETIDNAISGSEMQVDVVASLPAGTNAIGKLAANSGVDIGDVDVTSVTPGTAASNLGKAEDAAHTTGDVGVMALAVRQNADAPLSGADGDYEPLQTDANGYLKVNIKAGAAAGGTSTTDDSAFTAGSGSGTPIMGFATSDAVDAGDVGVLAMDTNRNLKISIEADNVGIGGGTQYTEDAVAPADPAGNAMMLTRDDALSTVTEAEGDWSRARGTAEGALWTQDANSDAILADTANMDTNLGTVAGAVSGSEMQVDVVAALPAGDNNIGNVDIASSIALDVSAATVTVDLGANNDVTVQGEDAENAAAAANPVQVGGRYDATPRTLNDGDVGAIALDADGAVQISDGGNTITVDGTIDLGATDNAVLDAIQAAVETIDNAISGAEMQVDIVADGAGLATAANQSTANTSLGNIETDTGNMDTSLNNIEAGYAAEGAALGSGVLLQGDDGTDRKNVNVDATTGDVQVDVTNTVTVDLGANNDVVAAGDVAHDSADSGNPIKVGGKAKNFDGTVPGTAVAEDDRADFISDVYGRQYVETTHPNYWRAIGDYGSAQTNTTLKAAPGAGLKLYITDITISNGATAGEINLLDGSGGTEVKGGYFAVNGGLQSNQRTPIVLTANTLLAVTSVTVTTHKIFVEGYTAP